MDAGFQQDALLKKKQPSCACASSTMKGVKQDTIKGALGDLGKW